MQVEIILEPKQQEFSQLGEVLRAFAADSGKIRTVRFGKHTFHNNGVYWWTRHGNMTFNNLGEVIAWIIGHEAQNKPLDATLE